MQGDLARPPPVHGEITNDHVRHDPQWNINLAMYTCIHVSEFRPRVTHCVTQAKASIARLACRISSSSQWLAPTGSGWGTSTTARGPSNFPALRMTTVRAVATASKLSCSRPRMIDSQAASIFYWLSFLGATSVVTVETRPDQCRSFKRAEHSIAKPLSWECAVKAGQGRT